MSPESPAQARLLEIQPIEVLPWSIQDSWLGVGLAIIIVMGAIIAMAALHYSSAAMTFLPRNSRYVESVGATALELVYVIPVILILAWRRANWLALGFRKFTGSALGLGCGLVVLTYMLTIVYSTVLVMLKIKTQGQSLLEIMAAAGSPVGIVVAAVLAAPIAEEIFFRGFLFQGLRQKYGWNKAAILSSLVFASLHLQLAALFPTFLLGYVFSFIYHKSNSIWPGIILHFLINSFAMCAVLSALQFSHLH